MANIEEMNRWSYFKTWKFFTENASNRLIPESELYLRSLTLCLTEDLREDKDARKKILDSLKNKSLIFIDGSSLNGKTTFANRLANHIEASIVDIDLICKDWIEERFKRITNPFEQSCFMMQVDRLTDVYILENLERIIKEKSQKGNVILVGSYMEIIYRAIIAKTLGRYFNQVVSIYCCAKSFRDVKIMKQKREKEFGFVEENDHEILDEYNYSKRLLVENGIMLGFGMTASFIADTNVSDMFV